MPTATPDVWTQTGSCAGHPHPEWWDTAGQPGIATAVQIRRRAAAHVCSGCPALAACLTGTNRSHHGQVRAGGLVDKQGRVTPIRRPKPPRLIKEPVNPRDAWPGQLAECGSTIAARRHIRNGENCAECRVKDGHRLPAARRRFDRQVTAPCGGKSAWRRHSRRGEACWTCWPKTGHPARRWAS